MEKQPPALQELFPHLSPEELKTAEENLDLYLKLIMRIFERLEGNPQADTLTPMDGTLPCTSLPSEPSPNHLLH